MPDQPQPRKPVVTVLTSKQCPHCNAVKQSLNDIVKIGLIDDVQFIDIEDRTDEFSHVRSVPWIRIGDFELHGLHSKQELQDWISKASDPEGMQIYIDELLSGGQLPQVMELVKRKPELLHELVKLTANPETAMATRIGIGALLENLQGTGLAKTITEPLQTLCNHADKKIRADCAHFLGLTENKQAINTLKKMLNDPDEEVREIAEEELERLS
ncbi:MAG: HEAT repeat domain-containing protein [Gammaproteobacteria bacterium]|nr:HEAT repeat domain-containing protein [Gammaproteobacteria bacterium]MDH5592843.1 HEAT repeat domain-containing protein [Gammaproteobacteria bacterium]